MRRWWRMVAVAAFVVLPMSLCAQVGEYRDDLSVGVSAGYVLSSVGFVPKVPQGQHGGMTAGVAARYVCEKYYTMICSVLAEVNFASMGWKEDILDIHDQPVINGVTGVAEASYSRSITTHCIPFFS